MTAPIDSSFNIFKVYRNITKDELSKVIAKTFKQTKAGSTIIDFNDEKVAEFYNQKDAAELKAFDRDDWLTKNNIKDIVYLENEDDIDSYLKEKYPVPNLPE